MWKSFAAVLLVFAGAWPLFGAAPVDGYKVVARLPHSTQNYTEGFLYLDGVFWEGTGLDGHSAVFAEDPQTGSVRQTVTIAPEYFGEGIVDWGQNLYEWTWKWCEKQILRFAQDDPVGSCKLTRAGVRSPTPRA